MNEIIKNTVTQKTELRFWVGARSSTMAGIWAAMIARPDLGVPTTATNPLFQNLHME